MDQKDCGDTIRNSAVWYPGKQDVNGKNGEIKIKTGL